MDNAMIINKLHSLLNQTSTSREQNLQIDIQFSVIRQAFAVKLDEIVKQPISFNRQRAQTENDITTRFQEIMSLAQWAKNTDRTQIERDAKSQADYFIQAVYFFDPLLADKLYNIAQ